MLISAYGPPDDAVRTAGEAARIARGTCYEHVPISALRSERIDGVWIVRLEILRRQATGISPAGFPAADGDVSVKVTDAIGAKGSYRS